MSPTISEAKATGSLKIGKEQVVPVFYSASFVSQHHVPLIHEWKHPFTSICLGAN
jgi:hypothetical protein